MRRYLPILFVLLAGCAAEAAEDDEDVMASEDAISVQCGRANTVTRDGATAGAATTTLNKSCILGKAGESGAAVVTRIEAIVRDTARLGQVTKNDGTRMFSKFTPVGRPTETAAGLAQDVDVSIPTGTKVLGAEIKATARLRFVRKRNADGSYDFTMTNATAIGVLGGTTVRPGNMDLALHIVPGDRGVFLTGESAVKLEDHKDSDRALSQNIGDIFNWLKGQLGR